MSRPRHVLADEDAERLVRILQQVDPTPDHVYEQARARFRWALELRQGGIPVPALPVRIPSRAAVLNSTAPLGPNTAGGAVVGDAPASPAPTAQVGGEADATRATAAGAVKDSGRRLGTPVESATAPARLRRIVRIGAGIAAFLLLVPLAITLGVFLGDLALLYLT